MDNKSDKNSIKEMLEGHKKKFNVVAVVVGIAVVIVIGLGAFYVIHTLNSTPQSYTEKNLNKYMENTKAQTENSNTQTESVNVNNTTPTNENEAQNTETSQNSTQGNAQSNNNQNTNQPKTYPVATASGNNTQNENAAVTPSNNQNANSNENQQSKATSSGPQIINPYAKPEQKKTRISKVNAQKTKTNTAIKHKKTYAAKKMIKRHKKHGYVAKKQYALQVSSNLDKKFVSITLNKLKRCGYKAYIRIKIINNKVYRRVMVGPISGYTAAKDEAILIKRQLKLNYMPIIKRYDKIP